MKKKKIIKYALIGLGAIVLIKAISRVGSGNSSSSSSKTSSYKSYSRKVDSNISQLSEENKKAREKKIEELKANVIYKELVDSGFVSAKYLPILNAISEGFKTVNKKGELQLLPYIQQMPESQSKIKFIAFVTNLTIPSKGGLTPELVEMFERYRKRYNYYGRKGDSFTDIDGNVVDKITGDYDLSSIFGVLDPENSKVLNAIYEAKQKGLSRWHKKGDHLHPHLANLDNYNQYVKKVFPESPYVLNVDHEVTAYQLYREYNANEIAADNKYKGKKLAVTGRIADMSETFGSIYVNLKSGDVIGWTKIACEVEDREVVAKLRKGQQVTMIGKCTGFTLNVSIDLRDCKLWK